MLGYRTSIMLGLLALSGTMAAPAPDEVTKHISPNNIQINGDESAYHCAAKGVNCIHVEGAYQNYNIQALDGAKAMCTREFQEPGQGKFEGPLGNSGKCMVTSPGTFLIECVVTAGRSYVTVDFSKGKADMHAVGQSTAELRSRKFHEKSGFVKDATINHGGVDAFIKCPMAP